MSIHALNALCIINAENAMIKMDTLLQKLENANNVDLDVYLVRIRQLVFLAKMALRLMLMVNVLKIYRNIKLSRAVG